MCNIISKNIVNEQNNTGAKANQQIAEKKNRTEMQEEWTERAWKGERTGDRYGWRFGNNKMLGILV